MAQHFELLPGVFWLVSDISPEFNLQADVDFFEHGRTGRTHNRDQ